MLSVRNRGSPNKAAMNMKKKPLWALLLMSASLLLCSSFRNNLPEEHLRSSFPYKKARLTERQAAAQLLSRFTFGATPSQVEEVIKIGLVNWFKQQLDGNLPDDSLGERLKKYDALAFSNNDIAKTFLGSGEAFRMAIKAGYIKKDSVGQVDESSSKALVKSYMLENGFRPEQELYRQLISEKILTAIYSRNQLQQVLTDFWFNHFNVSITKNSCAPYILAYERDVIRPNATGKFEDLLLGTAKSPAMLYFLDNFSSTGVTTAKKPSGLNENYAREVMELHTMGVDGGYTQQDVTQAARVLTGWTVYPFKKNRANNPNTTMMQKDDTQPQRPQGFVQEGGFQFVPNRHDKEAKKVLNVAFAAGGGYEEGLTLMHMLAHHPSTAKFITYKLAVRFVSDNPPKSLLDKMAKTFLAKDGDIKAVLLTMVSSPEFWNAESIRGKVKSPFELAISAVRGLDADVQQPYQLFNWVTRMGQKVYYYQAPTGFPDKAQYWISTGALLNRMNFGLALSAQRIPGIRIDLAGLNDQHEPESPRAALATYSSLIMPERNLTETIKRLTPLLNDPELVSKVHVAASRTPRGIAADTVMSQEKAVYSKQNSALLGQVVGMVIGSPEFQRR
jgi:uncharacterized protein (DUF1800 family)